MGIFDRLPPAPRPEPEPPEPRSAWEKPEATLPGIVAAELRLAHSPGAAVAITGLAAYPNGFELVLTAWLRRFDRYRRIADLLSWTGLPGRSEPLPGEFLRFGVQFSDGRVATNVNGTCPRPTPSRQPQCSG